MTTTRRIGRCSPNSRSHIIPDVYDPKLTLCGESVAGRQSTSGITRASLVQSAIDAYDPEWCDQCLYFWSTNPRLPAITIEDRMEPMTTVPELTFVDDVPKSVRAMSAPRAARQSKWVKLLEPLVDHPDKWGRFDLGKASTAASTAGALRKDQAMWPAATGTWEFVVRGTCLYAQHTPAAGAVPTQPEPMWDDTAPQVSTPDP